MQKIIDTLRNAVSMAANIAADPKLNTIENRQKFNNECIKFQKLSENIEWDEETLFHVRTVDQARLWIATPKHAGPEFRISIQSYSNELNKSEAAVTAFLQ